MCCGRSHHQSTQGKVQKGRAVNTAYCGSRFLCWANVRPFQSYHVAASTNFYVEQLSWHEAVLDWRRASCSVIRIYIKRPLPPPAHSCLPRRDLRLYFATCFGRDLLYAEESCNYAPLDDPVGLHGRDIYRRCWRIISFLSWPAHGDRPPPVSGRVGKGRHM